MSEQQRQLEEEMLWRLHYADMKDLEALLDEMGIKCHEIEERPEWILTKSS